MTGKPQLYLLELILAALCVGALAILLNRGFDIIRLQAFIVATVAVALGLAVFWIYFVPRAHAPHQRRLGFITALIVGTGLAPWVVAPLSESFFDARGDSYELFGRTALSVIRLEGGEIISTLSVKRAEAFQKKLAADDFKPTPRGTHVIYSRGNIRVELFPQFMREEVVGYRAIFQWNAQGLRYQVEDARKEAENYTHELELWYLK